jgi:hypothetical protein
MAAKLSISLQRSWESYLALENRGTREARPRALDQFVEELLRLPTAEWKQWALEVAESVVDEGADIPLRQAFFERVVFPALADALDAQVSGSTRWLAGLAQHLYRYPACRERLGPERSTEWGLLETALTHDSTDSRSRQRLIDLFESRLRYTLHELPAGVLFGHHGATVPQCDELLAELDEFRSLIAADGRSAEYHELVTDCDRHFRAYTRYLQERSKYQGYQAFLDRGEE